MTHRTIPHRLDVEQRHDERHMTVLIVGKVRSACGEFACVVNNVSRGGLHARFPHPPRVGERLTFALRGLPEMTATVRWTDDRRGGVEFDGSIDLDAILARYGSSRIPRPPRFVCNRPTQFILDGRGCVTEVLDVSLGGAKLAIPQPASADVVGRAGTLILPILDQPRAGTVQWVDDGRAGFKFAVPLPLDALAEVLANTAG